MTSIVPFNKLFTLEPNTAYALPPRACRIVSDLACEVSLDKVTWADLDNVTTGANTGARFIRSAGSIVPPLVVTELFSSTGNLPDPPWTQMCDDPVFEGSGKGGADFFGHVYWNDDTFSPDQYSKMQTFYGSGGTFGDDEYTQRVSVRTSGLSSGGFFDPGTQTCYYAYLQMEGTGIGVPPTFALIFLFKLVNGVHTLLANDSIPWSSGDELYLSVEGSTLTVKLAGDTILTHDDGAILEGTPGLGGKGPTIFDNWEGGDLNSGGSTTPAIILARDFIVAQTSPGPPPTPGFSWYKLAVIDHTQCGTSDSTDFPVCFNVTDADLKTISHGGFVTSDNGYDIRPFADVGLTEPLDFELVIYSPTTGRLEMHVRYPTLSHTVNGGIFLAFGNVDVTTDGSTPDTWDDDFDGVFHWGTGSILSLLDSTANGNTLTNHGATAVAGIVGGAANFNTQWVGRAGAFDYTSQNFTISFWLTMEADSPDPFLGYTGAFGEGGFYITIDNQSLFIVINQSGGGFQATHSAHATYFVGMGPAYVSIIRNGPDIKIRLNGVDNTIDDPPVTMNATPGAGPFQIGSYNSGAQGDITLDEYRLSAIARSFEWEAICYNNQKPSSTFLTWGSKIPT